MRSLCWCDNRCNEIFDFCFCPCLFCKFCSVHCDRVDYRWCWTFISHFVHWESKLKLQFSFSSKLFVTAGGASNNRRSNNCSILSLLLFGSDIRLNLCRFVRPHVNSSPFPFVFCTSTDRSDQKEVFLGCPSKWSSSQACPVGYHSRQLIVERISFALIVNRWRIVKFWNRKTFQKKFYLCNIPIIQFDIQIKFQSWAWGKAGDQFDVTCFVFAMYNWCVPLDVSWETRHICW